jgi:hypothetical protein
MWKSLAHEAQTSGEKGQIVTGLVKLIDDWAFAVIEFFVEDEDDKVSYRAEKALENMEDRRQRLNPDGGKNDEDEDEESEKNEDEDGEGE